MIWQTKSRPVDLTTCRVMGILNVTPDSFSDGGAFLDPARAVAHAMQMVSEGADLLDVGAESTRPGSTPVDPKIQIDAVVPIIRSIRERDPRTPISIDTRSSAVAREALCAGADMVNDVSAGEDDIEMFDLVRNTGAGMVLMHMMGRPETGFADPVTHKSHDYVDVIREVCDYLEARTRVAEQHGVARDQIVIDPGFGFGKGVQDNLCMLAGLKAFQSLPFPLLVGVSRKRFIGAVLNLPNTADRLHGSLAAAATAVLNGALIVRVHDVAPTVEVVKMCNAILQSACTERS